MPKLVGSSKVSTTPKVNDFVVKFANVNGSGSASANNMFAKALFRMGIPVSPHNIFPSNIQGLPTWYEVRINQAGYLGRREGVDLMVAMNEQTIKKDIDSVVSGGFVLYDSSKALANELHRDDVHYLPIPLKDICLQEFEKPAQRQLFKNIVYVGALSAFLNIDFKVLTEMVSDQFRGKEKLILPNIHALELGHQYASENFDCPLPLQLKASNKNKSKILMDGNTAVGLGCVYGGATIGAWYFKSLMNYNNGDWYKAYADYTGGQGAYTSLNHTKRNKVRANADRFSDNLDRISEGKDYTRKNMITELTYQTIKGNKRIKDNDIYDLNLSP